MVIRPSSTQIRYLLIGMQLRLAGHGGRQPDAKVVSPFFLYPELLRS